EIEILSSDDKQYQKLLSEINQMEKESKSALTEIIDSCQSRVIHVDNPPLGIKGGSSKELELNKKKRNNSRQKVLEHLNSKDCKNIYNPSKLQKLSATKTKKESEGEKNENVRTSKDAEDESEKVSVENNKIESVVEKEDKGEANNNEKELKS
ncbi:18066_t:CDS:2, partial [Racocetra persica]